jgi:lipopolysaccharide transport system ATP-binding protein
MSTPAIVVENLAKRYTLRHQAEQGEGLRHVLQNALSHPLKWLQSKANPPPENGTGFEAKEEFWALKDVSFEVNPGEVVGIIGRNGAGKSTLLKILSRITEPTRGRVRIRGRVASLLEVGTGFHAELTGRENIYLNGTILGMTRREIKQKFDEIIAFAEIEKVLDTPVKRYSSGMYVRLAFAVAAHLEPEILIIDEVLAVGDAQFQAKCLGKMQDVSQREGRTVLFVSHNMAAVSTLTKRVVLLRNGEVEYSGPSPEGIQLYMSTGANIDSIYVAEPSKVPKIIYAQVECSESSHTQASGKAWSATFRFHYPFPVPKAHMSFQIVNQYQNPVLLLCAYDYDFSICKGVGVTEVRCDIAQLDLNVGRYHLKIYLSEPPGGEHYDTVDHVCPFDVVVLDRTTRFGWRPDVCTYLKTGDWSVK